MSIEQDHLMIEAARLTRAGKLFDATTQALLVDEALDERLVLVGCEGSDRGSARRAGKKA